MRGWIGNSDVKNTDVLQQARADIEQRMEAFREAEKITKMKAYSKQGLMRQDELNPEDQARQTARTWIEGVLRSLDDQINVYDAEWELLNGSRKKRSQQRDLEELDKNIGRHRWHVGRLELLMRQLDNGNVDPSSIEDLKEDVEYFVESSNNGEDPGETYDEEMDMYSEYDFDLSFSGGRGQRSRGESEDSSGSGRKDSKHSSSSSTPQSPITRTTSNIPTIGRAKIVKSSKAPSPSVSSKTPTRTTSSSSPKKTDSSSDNNNNNNNATKKNKKGNPKAQSKSSTTSQSQNNNNTKSSDKKSKSTTSSSSSSPQTQPLSFASIASGGGGTGGGSSQSPPSNSNNPRSQSKEEEEADRPPLNQFFLLKFF